MDFDRQELYLDVSDLWSGGFLLRAAAQRCAATVLDPTGIDLSRRILLHRIFNRLAASKNYRKMPVGLFLKTISFSRSDSMGLRAGLVWLLFCSGIATRSPVENPH